MRADTQQRGLSFLTTMSWRHHALLPALSPHTILCLCGLSHPWTPGRWARCVSAPCRRPEEAVSRRTKGRSWLSLDIQWETSGLVGSQEKGGLARKRKTAGLNFAPVPQLFQQRDELPVPLVWPSCSREEQETGPKGAHGPRARVPVPRGSASSESPLRPGAQPTLPRVSAAPSALLGWGRGWGTGHTKSSPFALKLSGLRLLEANGDPSPRSTQGCLVNSIKTQGGKDRFVS